ncbi:uncharacterized protein LOC127838409 isoform X2 [Dreissena polymorpha]|nr:uncharacterized protein LOC127838409 isoform X2 [Dreissena polymorpha]
MDSLFAVCEKYLSEIPWNPENCIDIYYLAKRFRLKFYKCLVEYVTKDFLKIIEYEDNSEYVTTDMMLEIADSVGKTTPEDKEMLFMTRTEGSSNGISQEMRFRYFRQWLNFDVCGRKETFTSLFLTLTLEDTSHAFFESLASDYIQNFSECREHYYQTKRISMKSLVIHSNKIVRAVLVVAEITSEESWFGKRNYGIFGYDTHVNKWTYVCRLPNTAELWFIGKKLITVNEWDNCLYVYSDQRPDSYTDDEIIVKVQKYNLGTKSWSICEYKIPHKKGVYMKIKKFACVDKYVCFIAKSEDRFGEYTNVNLYLLGEHESCDKTNVCRSESESDLNIKMCVTNNRYIVIMCTVISFSGYGVVKTTRFLIKDVITKKTRRRRTVPQTADYMIGPLQSEECMFASNKGVVISKIDSPFYKILNAVNGHCSSVNHRILPRKLNVVDTDEEEEEDDDEFVGFEIANGFNVVSVLNRFKQLLRVFDFETREVTQLPKLSYRIVPRSISHARVPSYALKCVIDCPHCLCEMRCNI